MSESGSAVTSPPAEDAKGGGSAVSTLPVVGLTALVVGSMIGGGIFGLPSQMAKVAAPGALLIGWIITGAGMLVLAMCYQRLAVKRPDIDGGVYGYARAGFGDYVGYASAWGYWLSAWIGNVGYLVLLMSSLGVVFPMLGFGSGNTLPAIACASVVLWLLHFLVLQGVQQAAFVNTIVTVAKVVPLVVFIGIAIIAFDAGLFTQDVWGRALTIDGAPLGSILDQTKGMMLVTVWVFIGVEGASVFSERARSRRDVGRATLLGFALVLVLLLLVNFLSYGLVEQDQLAAMEDPSLAHVLAAAVGDWGATFISAGLAIALIGAVLAWVLMCAEILRLPSRDGVLPAWLGKENRNGTPVGALILTNVCCQALLIWTHFNEQTYTALIILASALILLPYLLSAIYQLLLAVRGGTLSDKVVGGLATVYTVWLLYAGGIQYLLISAIVYLAGTALFVQARRTAGGPIFKGWEYLLLAIFTIGAIAGVIGLSFGVITV
ncbi:arginine-ornithine antiporter [Actinomyces slackii]|uniref:Arginine-ornithine antiporter n=1 Tax=Actinomyces slackii TaxID=52774 RepID=A0A448KEX0_9ACTO|nr:arginine-ornithine antiporter [Actinomyces slackii]VEG75459.1 Arginine/ornithine antiporter [Actinomyces slackii]